MPKALTPEQNDWLEKVSGLTRSAAIDENVAKAKVEASADPRTAYTKARTALTAQLKQALPLDSEKKLTQTLGLAETHFKNEKFAEALETIEAAGELATTLITASKTYQRKDGKVAPSQADQIGVEKAPKSKELGAGVRQEDINSDVYYADTPEKRERSEFDVDQDGRLVDAKGRALDGSHGYAVSAEDGTKHHFDSAEDARKDGKKLHHSSEVDGRAVTAAGEQTAKEGVLRKVTDKSGHYKPDGEMTHNYVKGLVDKDVKRRDETIYALGEDGKPRPASPEEIATLKRAKELKKDVTEKISALLNEQGSLDGSKDEVAKKRLEAIAQEIREEQARLKNDPSQQQVLKSGIGPRQQDAAVEVFDPRTRFSDEDWKKVKGDKNKIIETIKAKLGMKLEAWQSFPERFDKLGVGVDINDMNKTNDLIGTLLRAAEVEGQEHFADKSKTIISQDAEQFVQTGGNVKGIIGKQNVNAELVTKKVNELGGEKKLSELGIDPTKFTPDQQLLLLETPNAGQKLAQLGIKKPAEVAPDTLIEFLETPDALVEKVANLGGAAKLDQLGFDPAKLNLMQQLKILETPGFSAEGLQKIKDFGIKNPTKLSVDMLVEFLQTPASLLKDLAVDPSYFNKPDDTLKFIRLTHGQDLAKIKQFLVDKDNPYKYTEDLQKFVADAEQEKGKAEIETLGGAAKFGELVGNLTANWQWQLDILRRAGDFAGKKAPEILKQLGVKGAADFDDVDAILELVNVGNQINERGGQARLDKLGIKKKLDRITAEGILALLKQLEEGAAKIKSLGLDPEAYDAETQLRIVENAQALSEGGGGAKLAELKIDLKTTGVEGAVALLKAEPLGGAKALAELGFPDGNIFPPADRLEILERKEEFKGLGGAKALAEVGFPDPTVFSPEEILYVLGIKQEFAALGGGNRLNELRVDITKWTPEALLDLLKGALTIKQLGFDPTRFTAQQQLDLVDRQADFAGLGGEAKLQALGETSRDLDTMLSCLQAAAALELDGIDATQIRLDCLQVAVNYVRDGKEIPDEFKKGGSSYSNYQSSL